MAWPVIDCAPGVHSHSTVVGDLLRRDEPALRVEALRASASRLGAAAAGLGDDVGERGFQQRRLA